MSLSAITDSSVAFSLTVENTQAVTALVQTEGEMKKFVNKTEDYLGKFGKNFQDILLGTAADLSGFFQTAKSTLTSLFGSFASYGDEMAKMAQRTGIGASALSEFKYIAGQCGTSIEAVETAIRSMQRTMYDASKGSGELKAAYESLGLSLGDLRKQSPEEQFRTLARAIASVEDPVQRNAVAMKLFGDSGTQLMALFNSGPEGMDKLAAAAQELGVTLGEDDYKAAENLTDAMDNMKTGFEGVQRQIVTGLAPVMTSWADKVADALKVIISFTKEHQTLAKVAGTVVIGLTAVAGGIYGVAKAYQIAAAAQALFTAHPIALVLTGIAAAAIALVTALGSASTAAAELSDEMAKLSQKHKEQRDIHKDYFAKLEELSQKQNKTSDDIKNAAYYADQLNAAYGGLGITVDSTTGKISGLSAAFQKMVEAQKAQRIADINAEISEQEINVGKKVDKIADLANGWTTKQFLPGFSIEYQDEYMARPENRKKYVEEGGARKDPETGRWVLLTRDNAARWDELTKEIDVMRAQITTRLDVVSQLEQDFDVEEADAQASGAASGAASGGATGGPVPEKDYAAELRKKLGDKNKKDELSTLEEERAAEIARLEEQLAQTTDEGERERIEQKIDEINTLSDALKEVLLAETDAAKGLEKFWSKFDEAHKPDFDAELVAFSERGKQEGADTFNLVRQKKATERAQSESENIVTDEEKLKSRLRSGDVTEEEYRVEADEIRQRKEKAASYDKEIAGLNREKAAFEETLQKRAEELKIGGWSDEEIEAEMQSARGQFGEQTNERIGEVRVRQATELDQRDQEAAERARSIAVPTENDDLAAQIESLNAKIAKQEQKRDEAVENRNQKDYEAASAELVKLTKTRDDKADENNAQKLKEASERFTAAGVTLDEAVKSGDKKSIGMAQTGYKNAQTELDAMLTSITPTMEESIKMAMELFGDSFNPSWLGNTAELDEFDPDRAVEEIENGVADSAKYESVGTFSAFESSKLNSDYNQKIYENGREQTRYLRDIVTNTKSATTAAVFA